MHIVFDEAVELMRSKFLVLELDQFRLVDQQVHTAWCVVENIPLEEMPIADKLREAHEDLIQSYRTQQWHRCATAINGLMGKWNGELDTFYENLAGRIRSLSQQELPDTWTGIIDRAQ